MSIDQSPNKSPEPTAVGAVSSAIAVHVASRRWLSFLRSAASFIRGGILRASLRFLDVPLGVWQPALGRAMYRAPILHQIWVVSLRAT